MSSSAVSTGLSTLKSASRPAALCPNSSSFAREIAPSSAKAPTRVRRSAVDMGDACRAPGRDRGRAPAHRCPCRSRPRCTQWSASGMSMSSRLAIRAGRGGKLELLVVPGKVVGPGAGHLERRIARRHLADLADEARAAPPRSRRRVGPSGRSSPSPVPSRVVGVGARAEAHGEAVFLAAVHREGHGLGRLAEGDRQHAGGERIERAGVAGLVPRRRDA